DLLDAEVREGVGAHQTNGPARYAPAPEWREGPVGDVRDAIAPKPDLAAASQLAARRVPNRERSPPAAAPPRPTPADETRADALRHRACRVPAEPPRLLLVLTRDVNRDVAQAMPVEHDDAVGQHRRYPLR